MPVKKEGGKGFFYKSALGESQYNYFLFFMKNSIFFYDSISSPDIIIF